MRAQLDRAKRFQPLAVLNKKLMGGDVYESNGLSSLATSDPSPSSTPVLAPSDPDEHVTRAHWHRPRPGDTCADPVCGRRLGSTNGCVNCRQCGRLFCDEHSMYQTKLSRAAQHDPVRGVWCRVCETCFKSRAGYNDHEGESILSVVSQSREMVGVTWCCLDLFVPL